MSPLTLADLQPRPPVCVVHPERVAVAQLDATYYCTECYEARINKPPEAS